MAIKYQGAVTKLISQRIASVNRKSFRSWINHNGLLGIEKKSVDIDLVSFSGTRDLNEQLISIASFLRYVGVPLNWYLYSDGSHTVDEISFLRDLFPFVKIQNWDINKLDQYWEIIEPYSKFSPASKKIQVIAGHKYERTTIFTDSDVLFGPLLNDYIDSEIFKENCWYMSDVPLAHLKSEGMFAFNFGFMIFNQEFNFEEVFESLKSLEGQYTYFSDQTAFGEAFRNQHGKVLDPRTFILDTSDQFTFQTNSKPWLMACRHYVNPVRHKMWQFHWRKALSL